MSAASPRAAARPFQARWREEKCAAFDLPRNSTAGRTVELELWGRRVEVYANANLSIRSGQACNARCPFCVEALRPASRSAAAPRAPERPPERDTARWFAALEAALAALRPLDPSVSVTGGEPTLDPRLPRLLRTLAAAGARKRTLTTNGTGLLTVREGRPLVDWLAATGVRHLNVSRALPGEEENARVMRPAAPLLPLPALREAVARARAGGVRVRLSCVLLRGGVKDLEGILGYLAFARALGVDNVVFRQLMQTEAHGPGAGEVIRWSDAERVALEPILEAVSADPRFAFQRQVVGYYYYVEVWRALGVDVVFEEADLAQLERTKRAMPGVVHELVFHPEARLASTWQPWDGAIGPE